MLKIFRVFLLSGFLTAPAFAQSVSSTQSVSVHVPSYLDISASSNSINLAFQENRAGAETNSQTITYTVKSNSMTQSDGAAGISAYLNDPFDEIDFQASFGSFSSSGGNTKLVSASPGFVTVGNTSTVLATKGNSSGDGKILLGQFPITYKASARSQLASGDYTRQLTLTLTDI